MQDSGDIHINVNQASTSQHSFKDFCHQVTDAQLLQKLKVHNDEGHARNKKLTKIQRVPEVLQRNDHFKQYYKPMELSIGPLHASDSNLSKVDLKIKLAARFIEESDREMEDLLGEIKNNLDELKMSFYQNEIASYEDEILARLLFLDGCVVLQFIHSYVNQSLNEFSINNGQADLIRQDLFLLENQIPFKVLQLLTGMNPQKRYDLWDFLLANNLMELRGPKSFRARLYLSILITGDSETKPVLHLLDLLRSLLVMDTRDDIGLSSRNLLISFYTSVYTFFYNCLICLPFWALDACGSFVDRLVSLFDDNWYPQQSFRNVQELKAAGITLKPNDCGSLKDISFHKRWFLRGRVELPSLLVDGSTARKMLNLVAYEMCSADYQENCYVTSYINLIDLLIDDEKDVKLLRSADILRNRLSTDTEVATLFNRIGSTCLSPPKDKYLDIKSDIENHYKRKLAVWMAQVYYTHFSSPWTILALLAAVTVLLLTAIQTWYAIHPKK